MSDHRRHAHLRQRSTAAVILTRPDPRPGGAEPIPSGHNRAGVADVRPPTRWRAVLTWIVLGAAIAALWALLLLGDSLVVSG